MDDDEDDLEPCYRHPRNLTAVHCSNCDRPICPDCSIAAPVGIKCPECGKMPKSARAAVPTSRVLLAGAVGLVVAIGCGVLRLFIPIPFLGLIIAYFLGSLIGEATVKGAGGFRDDTIAKVAAAVAAIGFLAPAAPLLLIAKVPNVIAGVGPFFFLAAAAAAYGAYQRVMHR